MTSPSLFQKFLDKLVPKQEFPALEIGEKAVSYLLLSRYDLSVEAFTEVQLPEGAIIKGELKNVGAFVDALAKLQVQINPGKAQMLPFIASLPSADFSLHVLELPDIPEASYNEAVRLNAGRVSPIALADAYMDWQNLGVNLRTLQREFLVAVAGKQRIDPYLEAFRQVGMQPLALESRSLSLLRLFAYFSQTVEKNITLLIIDIGQDGITFLVGKQGKLLFDFYLFWKEIPEAQDGTITREDLEAILSREVRRILEYYALHNDEAVQNFILFAPVLKQELGEHVAKTFSLRMTPVALPQVVKPDAAGQAPAPDLHAGLIGLSLRGSLIPREDDSIVSVLPENTKAAYRSSRMYAFASLWSKIVLVTLGGVLAMSLAVFAVVNFQYAAVRGSIDAFSRAPEAAVIADLEKQAQAFNTLVTRLGLAEKQVRGWSAYLDPVVQEAKNANIAISRISVSGNSPELRLWGTAPSQQKAFDFKTRLTGYTGSFSSVDVPLSSFSQGPGGTEFMLVATMK